MRWDFRVPLHEASVIERKKMDKDDSNKSVEELLDEYTRIMDGERSEDAVRMREIMAELERRGAGGFPGTKRP